MANDTSPVNAVPPEANGAMPLISVGAPEITPASFRESFAEDLPRILDLNTWRIGADIKEEYRRVEREVKEAVEREDAHQQKIRECVFPRLEKRRSTLPNAGVHEANLALLQRIHEGLLFNGGVEACDGRVEVHDTLPLTIYQVGVSLVSYRGDQGTWCERLFRRDLRQQYGDPAGEAIRLLESRSRRETNDSLGEFAQKTLMDYAERAILLRRSEAPWRMGHGNPITYELLTGGGLMELMVAGTNALRELVEKHQKFIFVGSEPKDRLLLTIGHALRPLEFAIVGTFDDTLRDWLHQERFKVGTFGRFDWDGEALSSSEWIPRFIETVASRVAVGVYRASALAPPQLFYGHVAHADLAAHIALADSMLQEQRGAPLLLDLAHQVCRTVFGESLQQLTESAYAAAGVPWRYR